MDLSMFYQQPGCISRRRGPSIVDRAPYAGIAIDETWLKDCCLVRY